ncbi:MAG: glycosyl transferase family 2 [Haloarculaceae archaeon]
MEYVQESVATLHDFGRGRRSTAGVTPDAPTAEATVVVPMTARECGSTAATGVLRALSSLDLDSVLVALHADPERAGPVASWLDGFDCDPDVLWCNAPAVERLLSDSGLAGDAGKGRDVWLALGVAAARSEYVVVHDADARSYTRAHVPKLLFPVARGYDFAKGYYARVENDRLYGRLCRLLFDPLVRTLSAAHDAPVLEYLSSFRYALAGEFAATSDLIRRLRVQRGWGLEVGTLGDAFEAAGASGTAQVDLGFHRHDHRSVDGDGGLGDMAEQVTAALFRVVEDAGVQPDYATLPTRYRDVATQLVEQYATDAAFNGLDYDAGDERRQVATYADAVVPPGSDTRLPAWDDAPLAATAVGDHAATSLAARPER